jgi:hypothetical protein
MKEYVQPIFITGMGVLLAMVIVHMFKRYEAKMKLDKVTAAATTSSNGTQHEDAQYMER